MIGLVMYVSVSFSLFRNCKPIFAGLQPSIRIYNACLNSRLFCYTRTKRVAINSREDPVIMKLDTPEFRLIFTPELVLLRNMFKDHGYELRIAGGAVRDMLSGKVPTDLDFATTATPAEMRQMFERHNIRILDTRGEKHGTITPRINDKENFEITTLRIDVETDGRHAHVEYTTDWKLDASRRDLTINSMFLDLDGTVYDYFYGFEDLKNKRVVFVGNADDRIKEDYLRILRYFRFYGRISDHADNHEASVLDAVRINAEGLDRISGERIWSELSKILSGRFAGELVLKMIELGLGPHIGLPQNPDTGNFVEVYERSKGSNIRPIALLAAFFRNTEEMLNFHRRAKLSSFDRDLGLFVVKYKDYEISAENPMKDAQALVVKNFKVPFIKEYILELLKYKGLLDLAKQFESYVLPKFPITGKTLIALGIPQGRALGKLLEKLKDEWINSNFSLTADQLKEMVPELLAEFDTTSKKFKFND